MFESIRNISLLAVSDGARVLRGQACPAALAAAFPDADGVAQEGVSYDAILGLRPDNGNTLSPSGVTIRIGRKRAGEARCFVILPSLERPRMALPLDSQQFYRAGLMAMRPKTVSKRILHRIAVALGTSFVSGDIVSVRGPGIPPIDQIARQFDSEARAVALLFGASENMNTAVIKILTPRGPVFAKLGRGAESDKGVLNEANILGKLAERPLEHGLTPAVLGIESFAGKPVLYLGEATRRASRHILARNWERVIPLVIELARYGGEAGTIGDSAVGQRVAHWLSRHPDPELENAWQSVLARIGDRRLPLGLGHGDFTPWNIFEDARGLTVLDWEGASERTPPGQDLARFLMANALDLHLRPVQWKMLERPFARFLSGLDLAQDLAAPLVICHLVDYILVCMRVAGMDANLVRSSRQTLNHFMANIA